jgi:hypothetical protein
MSASSCLPFATAPARPENSSLVFVEYCSHCCAARRARRDAVASRAPWQELEYHLSVQSIRASQTVVGLKAEVVEVYSPGLQALCAAQCSFWHDLLHYSTVLNALHLLRPPLGQLGHAQRRRSPAPDAPALDTEEAALVVAPL